MRIRIYRICIRAHARVYAGESDQLNNVYILNILIVHLTDNSLQIEVSRILGICYKKDATASILQLFSYTQDLVSMTFIIRMNEILSFLLVFFSGIFLTHALGNQPYFMLFFIKDVIPFITDKSCSFILHTAFSRCSYPYPQFRCLHFVIFNLSMFYDSQPYNSTLQ